MLSYAPCCTNLLKFPVVIGMSSYNSIFMSPKVVFNKTLLLVGLFPPRMLEANITITTIARMIPINQGALLEWVLRFLEGRWDLRAGIVAITFA